MKKIIILVSFVYMNLFAVTNVLIRGSQPIIDIGSNDHVSKESTEYNKVTVYMPALLKEIDHNIDISARLQEKENCIIDSFGNESCTIDEVNCNSSTIYSQNISKKHNGRVTRKSESIVIPEELNTSYVWYNLRIARKSSSKTKTVEYDIYPGGYLSVKSYSKNSCDSDSQWVNVKVDNIYKMKARCPVFVADDYDYDMFSGKYVVPTGFYNVKNTGYVTVYENKTKVKKHITVNYNVSYGGKHHDNTFMLAKVFNPEHTDYDCIPGYYLLDNETCAKDYIFYTYTCPIGVDEYGQKWNGPMINTGGDCQGVGVPEKKNGICPGQTATGFEKNCMKIRHDCPIDPSIHCVAKSADDNYIDNAINGKIYKIADSVQHDLISSMSLKCPNINDNSVEAECPPTWDKYEDLCLKEALDFKDNKAEGYGLLYNSKFFKNEKYASKIDFINGKTVYVTSQTRGLDYELNTCVAKNKIECIDSKYTYSKELKKCLIEAECPVKINNICYKKPEADCLEGFVLNELTGKCESKTECLGQKSIRTNNGIIENICIDNSNIYCPIIKMSYNTLDTNMCATKFLVESPVCNEGFDLSSGVCLKELNSNLLLFKNWLEIGASVKWSFNDTFNKAISNDAYWKFDKNGTIGTRLSESNGEKFFLNKTDKTGFFGISGDIDHSILKNKDWNGLVFGYKNINNFYVFKMKQIDSNNSLYNFRLSKISLINGKKKENILKESFLVKANMKKFKIGLVYKDNSIKGFINDGEVLAYDINISVSGKIGIYKDSNGSNQADIEKIYKNRASLVGTGYENEIITVHPNRVYVDKIKKTTTVVNNEYYIPEDLYHYEYIDYNVFPYHFGVTNRYLNYNIITKNTNACNVGHDYIIMPVEIIKDDYYTLTVDSYNQNNIVFNGIQINFPVENNAWWQIISLQKSFFLKKGIYPLKVKLNYHKASVAIDIVDSSDKMVWNSLYGVTGNEKRIPKYAMDYCRVNGTNTVGVDIKNCDLYKKDLPNDIPYYMKLDLLNLDTTSEEYICPTGYLEVKDSDQCYKDSEYFVYDRNETYSNFKMFDIEEESAFCNEGYILNEDNFVCYEDFNLTIDHYNFDTLIVNTDPSCKEGVFDKKLQTCVTEPICKQGVKTTDSNGNDNCQLEATFNCGEDSNLEYVDTNETHDIFNKDLEHYIGACKINSFCSENENVVDINGTKFCSNNNIKETCPEGYSLLKGFNICATLPKCKEGYVRHGNECIIHYSWYEYTCPADWNGPNELFRLGSYKSGGDCHGECGSDYCDCNSPIAPANSCSKNFNTDNLNQFVAEQKLMTTHRVKGNSLGAKEMNLLRNVKCSDNSNECSDGLNKIYGMGDKLYFEKKNGEKEFLSVDGCYFNGELNNGDLITGLKLIDPYTLVASNGYEIKKKNESYDIHDSGSKKMKICADSRATMKAFTKNGKLIVRITPGTHNCGGTGYYDFIKNDIKGVTPKDINISYIGGCLGKGKRTTLNTTLSVNGNSITMYGKCWRKGAQHPTVNLKMNYNIHVDKFTCPLDYIDPQNNNSIDGYCFKDFDKSSDQKITSSCKMNGHVGWSGRTGPITSVGNEVSIGNIVDMTVNGSVDMNNGTKWKGFNAATMALKFSDDNWYVISNVTDNMGEEVDMDLPKGIRLLTNKNYEITNYTDSCKYKDINLNPNLCGVNVKIKSPGTQLYLKEITDIESLRKIKKENVSVNNKINLSFNFNGTILDINKTGVWDPTTKVDFNVTKVDIDSDFNNIENRIRFWDSYENGYIGFIEFVNEVNYNDRESGFVPEFFDYEKLLGKGFTSIFLLSDKDAYLNSEDIKKYSLTYAVRVRPTSKESCENFASEFNGNVIDMNNFNIPERESLIKSMGMRDRYSCIISLSGIKIPDNSKYAIKIRSFTGKAVYKCSPYKCKDSKCIKASCEEGFEGNMLPDYFKPMNGECTEEVCDGNSDFVEVCGKIGNCPDSENVIIDKNGNCQKMYCSEGYFDMSSKKCIVKKCPPTTLMKNGKCVAE